MKEDTSHTSTAPTAKSFLDKGIELYAQEDYNAAISNFDDAIRLDSNNAEAYSYRGVSKGGLGKNSEGLTDINEAIRLAPDLAIAYNHKVS